MRNSDGGEVLALARVNAEVIAPAWTPVGGSVLRLGSAGLAVFADGAFLEQWGPPAHPPCKPSEEIRARVEDAVELLRGCGPAYYAWIAAVLREVVPLAPRSGTSSSSHMAWPGQLRLSVRGSLIEYVTALVHECSHQYFFMVQAFAPFVRPDAPDVFSALKNRDRPLEKALLGLHAVGNMLFAYQALLAGDAGVHTTELRGERDATRTIAASLFESMEPHWDRHLDEAGQELYVPLRDRLRAEGFLATPRTRTRVGESAT